MGDISGGTKKFIRLKRIRVANDTGVGGQQTVADDIPVAGASEGVVGEQPIVDEPTDSASDTGNGVDGAIDPESVGSTAEAPYGYLSNGEPRRRRAKGSRGNRTVNGGGTRKRATPTETTGFIASLLLGGHEMLAKMMKMEQLELDKEEANTLASAIINVTEQYDVVPMLDPKTMAWIQLAKTVGGIYGPRIMSARIDARAKAAKQPVAQRNNVTPMPDLTATAVGTM